MDVNLNEFVCAFAALFEDVDNSKFTAETNFKDYDAWDSLMVLMVIAMIRTNYGINLSGLDVNNCTTIADVYSLMEKVND